MEVKKPGRGKYKVFSDDERYTIGKYASIHGPMAAVKKFQSIHPKLNESTVRAFRAKYHGILKKSCANTQKKITSLKRGRPLLLGSLDEIVKQFLLTLRKIGGVVNTVIANATAKALIDKSADEHLKVLDLESSFWAKSLFQRMGFVKRVATTSRPEIPTGARKEAELIFHHEIVSKIENYHIPSSLVINIDQTPSKYAPVSSQTLAQKNSKHVCIKGSSFKQAITATFGITLSNSFLPMQLIYGGKTAASIPKFKFPKSFSLSANPKHYSNTEESLKLLNEVIIPYVNAEREKLGLDKSQFALLVMDVFTGQMTEPVKEKLRANNILLVRVPANMTNLFQPLDLTVNGSVKALMKQKFTLWYSQEISKALNEGVPLDDIEINLKLSVLKPLHAKWLLEVFNHMTSDAGKSVIENGWKSAGISNAVSQGLSNLDTLDPFDSIDPLVQESQDYLFHQSDNVPESDQLKFFITKPTEIDDDDDDVWIPEEGEENTRNIFEILDDEDD